MPRDPKPELVVITGSSGLIGSRIVQDLVPTYRVVGIDVQKPDSFPDAAAFVECDLTGDESVRRAIAGVAKEHGARVASVIHLAAYYDFSGAPSPLYETLTVEGTRRLLRELNRSDLEVEQFVFSSTSLVMKPASPGEVITEDSARQGEWDYPQSKIAAEDVIAAERGRIPAVILRIAGAYDEKGHSPPITQQIKRIYERQPESHLFPGNKKHSQPFVHIDDVVAAFRCTIEKRHSLGGLEVFLIAEPNASSYADLQDRIGELVHGQEWTTMRIPGPVAKAGAWIKEKLPGQETFIKPWMVDLADAHYPLSIERARQRLGWRPDRELFSTLPAMVSNLNRDPAGFYRENKLGEAP